MREIHYKGYVIEATPLQLAESRDWTIQIIVSCHYGTSVNTRQFSARNTCPTEEEAIRHCFNFGRQIIDGEVENCSVIDL